MKELETLLIESAENFGINITNKQVRQFMLYKDILLETNKKFNLTAITDDREVILKHFIDCLSVLKFYDFTLVRNIIDIGSGAGFPGIPLKIIFPRLQVTIIDSLNKRINFLKDVVSELNLLDVTCIHERAEILGCNQDYREKFDICTSRAVAYLPILSEYCLPFVKPNGYFLAMKGPNNIQEEIDNSLDIINLLGGFFEKIENYVIPHTNISHNIIFIKKNNITPKRYPRKTSQIKNNITC